eukprot:symbB.v1.2.007271.t1/scaffold442.1/size205228/9
MVRLETRAVTLNEFAVEEESVWLHSLLGILWPRIDKFLREMVQEQILPEIDKQLPKMLRGSVSFPKVDLGRAIPHFRHISLKERSDQAILLEVTIDLASDMDVQIKAMKVPIGVKRLSISGQLNVLFHPVSPKPPFFAGITVFFIDPPELDMDFTGAADFVDLPVIRSVVRSTILDTVRGIAVLPARVAVDLNEDDDMDQADLSYPAPKGVLRVLVKSGCNLRAADLNLSGASSDPYVVIEVGQQRWQSSVIEKSLNPIWEHGNVVDFLVYEPQQKARISVFDKDRFSKDDLLGDSKGLLLEPYLKAKDPQDFVLPLNFKGKPAGELKLSCRWFELSPHVPRSFPSAVARGPSQLLLVVKIQGIVDLPRKYKPPFQVKITCGEHEMHSKKSTPPGNIRPVAEEVADIARRLQRAKHSVQQISEITGLEPNSVKLAVAQNSPSSFADAREEALKEMSATHPAFNQILYQLLPWTEKVSKSMVVLTLVDRVDKPITQPLAKPINAAIGSDLEGGFELVGSYLYLHQ